MFSEVCQFDRNCCGQNRCRLTGYGYRICVAWRFFILC